MTLSFAPMEGITAFPFRKAHARCFPGTDRYYTPFLVANQTYSLKMKEKKEIKPGNNEGVFLVPQILTKKAEQFVWALRIMAEMGYGEVNLNLGCPSPTVTRRGKGAGFLADQSGLDRFFEETFDLLGREEASVRALKVTVKTRTGAESASEARGLARIFDRYPLAEIIVHPRVGTQLYRGEPDLEAFACFTEECTKPVAYNGDIRSVEDYERIRERFPGVRHVMIGRGALADPALFREIRGGEALSDREFRRFHGEVLREWTEDIPDFRNVIGKMKELWFYWEGLFEENGRAVRRIRKARSREEYDAAVQRLFDECAPASPSRGERRQGALQGLSEAEALRDGITGLRR